jgi:hypothetical protein
MTILLSTPPPTETKQRTWTLYGEEYDFTHFLKAHPGGELALKMVEGKDCTSFFEQYHLRLVFTVVFFFHISFLLTITLFILIEMINT